MQVIVLAGARPNMRKLLQAVQEGRRGFGTAQGLGFTHTTTRSQALLVWIRRNSKKILTLNIVFHQLPVPLITPENPIATLLLW